MFFCTLKKYTTTFFLVTLVLFIVSAVSMVFFLINPTISDLANDTIAQWVRLALAKVTSPLPISLAELLICLSPLIVGILIFCFVKFINTKTKVRRFFFNLLGVVFLVATLYVFTIGVGYHTTRLDDKMGLVRENLSKEELHALAIHLHEKLVEDIDEVTFQEDGASVMPYSMEELSVLLSKEYDAFTKAYPSNISRSHGEESS